MAGGKRRNMRKTVAKAVQENPTVSSSQSDDPNAGSDLPMELLELIFSKLNLRDNILASAVCKRWLATAVSLRAPNDAPWLMSFPTSGSWYQFYDPVNRKMYFAEYKELDDSRILYAKDGWLLAFKPETHRVFFFHPYTRAEIELPNRQLALENAAFSAAPTSSNCFVITMENVAPTIIAITTCRPGDAVWTTLTYQSLLPFISSIWNKVVFCKGLFCCLNLNGTLAFFDPVHRTWSVTFVPPPQCTQNLYLSFEHWQRGKFLAEHDGDIFVVYTRAHELPFLYKLNTMEGAWVEMESFGDMTLFANSLSSVARSGFHGNMRNIIYFSKVMFYGRRCITYSPDSRRYYPQNRFFDWGKEDAFRSIWIDSPEDISVLG